MEHDSLAIPFIRAVLQNRKVYERAFMVLSFVRCRSHAYHQSLTGVEPSCDSSLLVVASPPTAMRWTVVECLAPPCQWQSAEAFFRVSWIWYELLGHLLDDACADHMQHLFSIVTPRFLVSSFVASFTKLNKLARSVSHLGQ